MMEAVSVKLSFCVDSVAEQGPKKACLTSDILDIGTLNYLYL